MNEKTKKEKDLEHLEKIIKLSGELQEALARYNAKHTEMDALYNMDNIIAQVWVIARNIRNQIEDT